MDIDDLDDCPVSYDEFTRIHGFRLAEGTLEQACRGQRVDDDAKFQLLHTSFQKKALTARVTDGVTCATVLLSDGKPSVSDSFTPGSIVRLVNLQTTNAELVCSMIACDVDASRDEVAMIDTEGMPLSVAASAASGRSLASVRASAAAASSEAASSLPKAFLAFQKDRKRAADDDDGDTVVPPPKAANTRLTEAPQRKDPFPRYPLMRLSSITTDTPQCAIGPVVIVEIIKPPEGTRRPTKVLVVDQYNTRMFYATFAAHASVEHAFGADWKEHAYYLAGGVIKKAYGTQGPHLCEVNFGLVGDAAAGSIKSAQDRLAIVRGSRDEYLWVLQCLRDLNDALPRDPVHRAGIRELSVIEALEATKGMHVMRGAIVKGLLAEVETRQTKKSGATFLSVTLVGRDPDGGEREQTLKFNIFSGAAQAMGGVLDAIKPATDYDRHMGAPLTLRFDGITITPNTAYPFEVDRGCDVTVIDNDPMQLQLCHTTRFDDLPVLTLAEGLAAPDYTRFTVYIAVGHMTEMRTLATRFGETQTRWMSYMDNSKQADGAYVSKSSRVFMDSPIIKEMLAVAREDPAPFVPDDLPVGGHLHAPPEKVIIVKAVNAVSMSTSPPKDQGGARVVRYISFDRETKMIIVRPDENDARAERLREWYKTSGHMMLVADGHMGQDAASAYDGYTQLKASALASSAAAASSSSSAAGSASAMDIEEARRINSLCNAL